MISYVTELHFTNHDIMPKHFEIVFHIQPISGKVKHIPPPSKYIPSLRSRLKHNKQMCRLCC